MVVDYATVNCKVLGKRILAISDNCLEDLSKLNSGKLNDLNVLLKMCILRFFVFFCNGVFPKKNNCLHFSDFYQILPTLISDNLNLQQNFREFSAQRSDFFEIFEQFKKQAQWSCF